MAVGGSAKKSLYIVFSVLIVNNDNSDIQYCSRSMQNLIDVNLMDFANLYPGSA